MSLKLVKKISIIKPKTKLSHNTFTFSILIQYSTYLISDEFLQMLLWFFYVSPCSYLWASYFTKKEFLQLNQP